MVEELPKGEGSSVVIKCRSNVQQTMLIPKKTIKTKCAIQRHILNNLELPYSEDHQASVCYQYPVRNHIFVAQYIV